MSTPILVTTRRGRRSTAAAVTLWLLVATVVMMLLLQLVEQSLFPPIGFIQAIVVAIPLVRVWRGIRGGFITAAVVVVLLIVASAGPIVSDLTTPTSVLSFEWTVVVLPIMLALLVSSIVAAVRVHAARVSARSVLDS
jgi:hypothetical protein